MWEAGLRNKLFISRTTDRVHLSRSRAPCSRLRNPIAALCDNARVQRCRSDSVTLKRARVRGALVLRCTSSAPTQTARSEKSVESSAPIAWPGVSSYLSIESNLISHPRDRWPTFMMPSPCRLGSRRAPLAVDGTASNLEHERQNAAARRAYRAGQPQSRLGRSLAWPNDGLEAPWLCYPVYGLSSLHG